MHTGTELGLIFFAGIALQALLILRKGFFRWDNIATIFLSVLTVFLLFGKLEISIPKNEGLFLLTTAIIWAFILAVYNKDYIMAQLNESVLLQLLIVAVYVVTLLPDSYFIKPLIAILILLPSPLIVYLGFTSRTIDRSLKLTMYLWFLVISVIVALLNINLLPFTLILKDSIATIPGMLDPPGLSPIGEAIFVFVSAAFSFGLLANIAYLLELIPITGKHQSWKSRQAEIKAAMEKMVQKYDDADLQARESILIMLIQGGLLLGNHVLGILPPFFAVSLSLVATQLIVFREINLASLLAVRYHYVVSR